MKGINTPYDSVFRTLLNQCPRLIIPVVNEIFKTTFQIQETVRLCNNEFFISSEDGGSKEKITDSCFWIRDILFHIECQSTWDKNIPARIYEYDALMSVREMKKKEALIIPYPCSAVLYLRSYPPAPDEISVPVQAMERSDLYKIRMMKATDYTLDDIFEKKLYFLIPFYIFKYEKQLQTCEEDDVKLEELTDDFRTIRKQLDILQEEGELEGFEKRTLTVLSKTVIRGLAKKYGKVRKELCEIMGGKILNYDAKIIRDQGREEGREKGREEGREEDQEATFLILRSKGYSEDEAQAFLQSVDELIKQGLPKQF